MSVAGKSEVDSNSFLCRQGIELVQGSLRFVSRATSRNERDVLSVLASRQGVYRTREHAMKSISDGSVTGSDKGCGVEEDNHHDRIGTAAQPEVRSVYSDAAPEVPSPPDWHTAKV